jgi:hypothetical protein
MSTDKQDTRRGFTTYDLLASVLAWMDSRPGRVADLVESVQVTNQALRVAGYDVTIHVTGGEDELSIMADAFEIDRADQMTGFHAMGEPFSDGKRWWRHGYFTARFPTGMTWHVTVASEVEAPGLTEAEEEIGRQIADEFQVSPTPGTDAQARLLAEQTSHEPVLVDHPRAAEGFPGGQVCSTCGTQWPCAAEVEKRDTEGHVTWADTGAIGWYDTGSGSGAERG